MKTVEISFGELRRHYIKVREFVKDYAGVETHQVGAYSSLEEDLLMDSDDVFFMGDDFAKKFEVSLKSDEKQVPKFLRWIGDVLGYLVINFLAGLIIYLWKIIIVMSTIVIIWAYFTNKFVTSQIKIPNKKEWNPELLSVADLVCMAVEQKEVYKKDIHFVIKKSR